MCKSLLNEVQYEVTVAMPSGLCVPSSFGMNVRREGSAR
jgi:hypothetical protein